MLLRFVCFLTPLSERCCSLYLTCLLSVLPIQTHTYVYTHYGILDLLGTYLWDSYLAGLRPPNTETPKQIPVPDTCARALPWHLRTVPWEIYVWNQFKLARLFNKQLHSPSCMPGTILSVLQVLIQSYEVRILLSPFLRWGTSIEKSRSLSEPVLGEPGFEPGLGTLAATVFTPTLGPLELPSSGGWGSWMVKYRLLSTKLILLPKWWIRGETSRKAESTYWLTDALTMIRKWASQNKGWMHCEELIVLYK